MLLIALHIDYKDGTGEDIVASVSAMAAAEERFDKATGDILSSGRVGYFVFLAYAELADSGRELPTFEEWRRTVVNIAVKDAGDPVPLESSPGIGS